MLVSWQWLCALVEIKESPEEIANLLTMSGIEVDGIQRGKDILLELDLTPDRADCLGMINIAREIAALSGAQLKLPLIEESAEGFEAEQMVQINIMTPTLCRRYVVRLLKNIEIKPSPSWLQERLLAMGVRPINNVVDVTNYVMLEMGQPLHAFDYDLLQNREITVRCAAEKETIITLDGQLRELNSEMLVIADAEKPVAIAGVMGGLATEVTAKTKTILLESAYFHGVSVRRTARSLGLHSEASLRFEKGIDLEQARLAADRAIQLLAEMGAGIPVTGCVDCFPARVERQPIRLRYQKVNEILGTSLTTSIMEEKLNKLQIKIVAKNKEEGLFLPPSYRRDLTGEIDLIEEIARLYGYAQIATTLPEGVTTQGVRGKEQEFRRQINRTMVSQGLYEVINFSFINPEKLDFLGVPKEHLWWDVVRLQNPLSEEQGIMRTTLLPGLLHTVQKNINNRNMNLKLFELGKVYYAQGFPHQEKLPEEKWMLAVIATGEKEKSWVSAPEKYDFYYLKGILENLIRVLGYADNALSLEGVTNLFAFHPGKTALVRVGGIEVGFLGEIHPVVLEKYEIEQRVSFLNIDIEKLWNIARKQNVFRESLPKYPAVTRDLALLVPEEIAAGAVSALIKQEGGAWLARVRLFDLYRGSQIPTGYKSLAFSLSWQATEKTLTDEEVNCLHQKIEKALQKKFCANLRH